MRRFLALMLVALLALPGALAEDEAPCFSLPGAPYWHAEADCRFGDTGWYAEAHGIDAEGEVRHIAVSLAEAEGQKPCPGCATAFRPAFTGDYTDWTGGVQPWGCERGELIREEDGWPVYAGEAPPEVLQAWGDAAQRLAALFPEETVQNGESLHAFPEDYAGIYANACGGYTILLKDPTPERVAQWRDMLACDFWVIAAKYGCAELDALRAAARGILDLDSRLRSEGREAVFHIVSIGTDAIGNAVEIGVLPEHFESGCALIRQSLAGAGFADPGMVRFVPANYPEWL